MQPVNFPIPCGPEGVKATWIIDKLLSYMAAHGQFTVHPEFFINASKQDQMLPNGRSIESNLAEIESQGRAAAKHYPDVLWHHNPHEGEPQAFSAWLSGFNGAVAPEGHSEYVPPEPEPDPDTMIVDANSDDVSPLACCDDDELPGVEKEIGTGSIYEPDEPQDPARYETTKF